MANSLQFSEQLGDEYNSLSLSFSPRYVYWSLDAASLSQEVHTGYEDR